jgi:hypothetical protein
MNRSVFSSLRHKPGLSVFVAALIVFGAQVSHASHEEGLKPGIIEAKLTIETPAFGGSPLDIQTAMAAQKSHTPSLLGIPEVVGTATAMDEGGNPAVLIMLEKTLAPGLLPDSLDGVPVVSKVTGKLHAMPKPPWAGGPGSGGDTGNIDPTSRFNRPAPIGVSTGNAGECSSGTIGARVTNGNSVFALSNNHVYALENNAPRGGNVLQPGRYDTGCSVDQNDVIGTLRDFEPLDFSGAANAMDAAIAVSSTDALGNATPADGYGTPKSATAQAKLGDQVLKYGRTTGQTQGEITGINGSVKVGYGSGMALFTGQIIVESNKPFIKAGDSGSLLVNSNLNPVGLLFAGNRSGKFAVANHIDPILTRFGVRIDGE